MVVDRKNQKAVVLLYLASAPVPNAANSSDVLTQFSEEHGDKDELEGINFINLISYRKFKHLNSTNFRSDISAQPWENIKELYDPNDIWKKWKDLFLSFCDKHAPVKTKSTRPTKSPWITTSLKKRMNFRDRLKNKAIKTKDAFIWNQFRKVKNQVC